MNDFNTGRNVLTLRTAAARAHVAPTNDADAQQSIALLEEVNRFTSIFKKTNGFSEYHPCLMANTVACAQSIVQHRPLASVRGNGRMATVSDHMRSIGHGMKRASKSIAQLYDLDLVWKVDPRTGAAYPFVNGDMPRSSVILAELKAILNERAKYANDRVIRKSTRDRLLLKRDWTDSKIIAYTIELLSRLFAAAMADEQRAELVDGDKRGRLIAAMDTIRMMPA